jgi:hypothetical protein
LINTYIFKNQDYDFSLRKFNRTVQRPDLSRLFGNTCDEQLLMEFGIEMNAYSALLRGYDRKLEYYRK